MGDKFQKYTIGEACKILNITQAGIRFYEKKGIIKSKRNEENGYRHYSFKEVNKLMTLREYNNLGFSLEEAQQLINHEDVSFVSSNLENKIEEIEGVIERNKRVLQELYKRKEIMDKLKRNLLQFHVVYSEPMYLLHCQEGEKVTLNSYSKELVKRWTENVPKVKYYSFIKKENLKPDCAVEMCLGVDEKDVDFEMGESEYISYIPKQRCFYTIIEVKENHNTKGSFYKLIKPTLAYIKENNIELIGDVFGRKIITLYNHGQSDYYEAYFPIK